LLLQKGSQGAEVKQLQVWMNYFGAKYITKITEDGKFGAKTEAALYKLVQKKQITLNQGAAILNSLKK
jgi:peptidoglycan hydrolase-like protein with peptidoglycan-binding domain